MKRRMVRGVSLISGRRETVAALCLSERFKACRLDSKSTGCCWFVTSKQEIWNQNNGLIFPKILSAKYLQ